jgi:hypothetical protein
LKQSDNQADESNIDLNLADDEEEDDTQDGEEDLFV